MTAPITRPRKVPVPRVPPEIIRPFSLAEYADRMMRVQTVLADRDVAALVVCDPANLFYLTGYNAW